MASDLLLNRVRAALDHQRLGRREITIVVAVSGGPDSLCLLHLLWRLRQADGPALHVAHLDHGFRGAESAAEARFVAQLAHTWEIPATVEWCDLPALVHATGQNRQDAARRARYAFLARVAQGVNATAVAVAHQADDQAETVLLHLLHGAGPAGLRGMRTSVPWYEWGEDAENTTEDNDDHRSLIPWLIRPLLDTTRAEIEHYCVTHALAPQHDSSNSATYYTRNRLRADLLPHLATYNPQIVAALTRTAEICADDYAYIQAQLDTCWPALVAEQPGRITFELAQWQQLPTALQRYALRRAALYLTHGDGLSYEQIEAGRAATLRCTGYQQTLGQGLVLRVGYTSFAIIDSENSTVAAGFASTLPQLAHDECHLTIPGITPLSNTWQAEGSFTRPASLPTDERWRWWVALDAVTLDGPLLFRRRRAGDRFRPAGGRGSRRLQDFFVDQKIPQELRAAWPILATPTSIVWLAGLRTDARFQATVSTKQTIWIKLEQMNNQNY